MTNYKERLIYSRIGDHLFKKQITIITSRRRTGKTTLINKLLEESENEKKAYFDLERIDNRELFSEKNYENIISALTSRGLDFRNKTLMAIDGSTTFTLRCKRY